MPSPVQSPEKELRFTRSGQAVVFWVSSAVCGAMAMTLLVTSAYRDENPALPHALWALLPLAVSAACGRLAWHLTKHAYLILTPLGIEIFPFFRPAVGMSLVTWAEVEEAEVDEGMTLLTLHHGPEKKSGVRISLRPIRADRRELAVKAVTGRISQGKR